MCVCECAPLVTAVRNAPGKRCRLPRGATAPELFSPGAPAIKRAPAPPASGHLRSSALCQQPFPEGTSFPVLPAGSGLCSGAAAPRRGSRRPGRAPGLPARPPAPARRRGGRLLRFEVAPKGASAPDVGKLAKAEPFTGVASKAGNKSAGVGRITAGAAASSRLKRGRKAAEASAERVAPLGTAPALKTLTSSYGCRPRL